MAGNTGADCSRNIYLVIRLLDKELARLRQDMRRAGGRAERYDFDSQAPLPERPTVEAGVSRSVRRGTRRPRKSG